MMEHEPKHPGAQCTIMSTTKKFMVLNNSVQQKPYQPACLMIKSAWQGWLPEGEKWISTV
jgi:hypothetical protein